MRIVFGDGVSGNLAKSVFRGVKARPELADRITRNGGADCTFVQRNGRSVKAELLIGKAPSADQVDSRPVIRVHVALKAPRLKRRKHVTVEHGRKRIVATPGR